MPRYDCTKRTAKNNELIAADRVRHHFADPVTCDQTLAVTGNETVGGNLTVTGTTTMTGGYSYTGAIAATTTVTGGTGVVATTGGVTASAGNIVATLGNITASAGNIAATLGSVAAGTTVTAGTGVTATTGGVTATAGGVTATAGDITVNSAAGNFVKVASHGCTYSIKVLDVDEVPNTASTTHNCSLALIPAGCLVLGVGARVGAGGVLATSATWSIGVSGATTRYGTTLARTAGTTVDMTASLASTGPLYYQSQTALVLTSSSGNWDVGAGGHIRICIFYSTITAPTS